MAISNLQHQFEQSGRVYESALLKFQGADEFDVYNTSVPFQKDGKWYLFGRLERPKEWSRSWVRLFERTGNDEWTLVPDRMIYPIEDPCVSLVRGMLVMAGTYVLYYGGRPANYIENFYRGMDERELRYFTTGPDMMKDIRLVDLKNGFIGVFSRPRSEAVRARYGSEAVIGFCTIRELDHLVPEAVENAEPIPGLFKKNEWGGCNQVYRLSSGMLGIIGHAAYKTPMPNGEANQHYVNIAFVLDPKKCEVQGMKVIGTRHFYPPCVPKKPNLDDCVFSSGIAARPDGKFDLYSGVGDNREGRIVIDDPFEGYGTIENLNLGVL